MLYSSRLYLLCCHVFKELWHHTSSVVSAYYVLSFCVYLLLHLHVLCCAVVCCQVLEELGDIIDLPMRAEAVNSLLAAGDSGLVASFEGLTVLEGTANNIKEAWRR